MLPTIGRIGLIPDIGQQGVFDPRGVTDPSLVADDDDPSELPEPCQIAERVAKIAPPRLRGHALEVADFREDMDGVAALKRRIKLTHGGFDVSFLDTAVGGQLDDSFILFLGHDLVLADRRIDPVVQRQH